MHAIKERVSDRLSRLFSDSPSSEPEARLYAEEEKSLSSKLSFVLPSVGFEWFRPTKSSNDAKLTQSNSFQWRSKSFSLKDVPLDRPSDYEQDYGKKETIDEGNVENGSSVGCENIDISSTRAEIGDPGSRRSNDSGSDIFEDAIDLQTPRKYMPNVLDDSLFISPHLYEFFESSLPNIVKGCQWVLLYSTARHGISLRTLIRKSADRSGPCLLIAGDKQGAVFGGLLECPLKPTPKRKYQGTNQTFVFTTIHGEPRLFRPTGANRYFYLCLNDLLALGGGGNFALCLSEDLLSGTSGPCETFGNLCLAHDKEFALKNVELWGFTHASPYVL